MSYSSWDQDPDRLRTGESNIAQIEAQIAQVPPDQRSFYQLMQRGIMIPPGYRLEPNGRLKYVAVDNSQPWYNKAQYMVPLIASAGLLAPYYLPAAGAAGAAAAATGAGASATIPTIGSTALTTGLGYGPASLAGTSALAGAGAGAAIPTIASRAIGTGMGYGPASLAGTGAIPSALSPNAPNLSPNVSPSTPNPNGTTPGGGMPGWQDLLKMFAPLAASLAAKATQPDPSKYTAEMPPELKELLALQTNRIKQSQPNYELMLRMARGLQPSWATNDTSSLMPRTAEPR